MSDSVSWESSRRKHVNNARGKNLHAALSEAGYFDNAWPSPPDTMGDIPHYAVLMNVLVDYLHYVETRGGSLELPRLQELVAEAYAAFEREPRAR